MFESILSLHCFCSNRVRLAATNALLNSLEFTRANFDVEVSIGCCILVDLTWFSVIGL